MKRDFGLNLSYMQAWRAKRKAVQYMRGDPGESYAKLPSYLYIIKKTYPGSVVGLHKSKDNIFLYTFVALYYSYRFGEILDGRYDILAAHGKGVFSTVIRAKDFKARPGDPEEVAIKIIRNNEIMYKAGTEELVILKKLVDADPEDKRHCVRLVSSFKYPNHLCLVFESLCMNLRELQKKFWRNIGLSLDVVRLYAKQLFRCFEASKELWRASL